MYFLIAAYFFTGTAWAVAFIQPDQGKPILTATLFLALTLTWPWYLLVNIFLVILKQ